MRAIQRPVILVASVLTLVIFPSIIVIGQQRPLKDAVVGTWLITSVYDIRENGQKHNHWGTDVKGTLVFGPDGSFTEVVIGDREQK